MTRAPRKNSFARAAAQFVFAALALATACRLVYLAMPAASLPSFQGGHLAPRDELPLAVREDHYSPASPTFESLADAELAELYGMCPMAASVDLKTVIESPERIDAILPPYQGGHLAPRDERPLAEREGHHLPAHRLTSDKQPITPIEPAVPLIRYPIAVRPSHPSSPIAQPAETSREAQAPASSPTVANHDDWLVDPKEWYAPGEGGVASDPAPAGAGAPQPAESSTQPSSDANAAATATDIDLPDARPADEPPSPPPSESAAEPTIPAAPPAAEVAAPAADEAAPQRPADDATTHPSAEELPQPPITPESQSPPSIFEGPPAPPAAPNNAGSPAAGSPQPPTSPGDKALGAGVDPHVELFAKNAYPSARECAHCHEDIYHEWSVSAHAYAAVSPMFHKFEQRLNDLSQGTVGYFCMRCHAPVATALCASRAEPLWNLPEVAREGITCIACHRVQYVYGKSNGERRIEPGNVFAPVFGGIGGEGVAETIHRKDHFKVKSSPDEKGPGQNIHVAGIYFDPLTRSEFCTPCHQVAVYPGIKLEVVWEQYRASPACKKGIQCQDCHMGRVPGLPLGYNTGPVAKIADKTVNDHRKKSNHIFYGPNYPIAHPGIFPLHLKANRWTMEQWLEFDWRAGWGTDAFEDRVADGAIQVCFPPTWAEADDRYDAREIIDDNLKKLNHKRDIRIEVMENGSHVEGPHFESPPRCGQDFKFHYVVTNTNEGHNLLTASLGAQPQYWANVVLVGPDGRRLWETGYLDSLGDLANIHSEDVRHKRIPYDSQLFNLQTIFLITGAKGTDREFFVPVNVDIDQLPFIRPGTQPISVINHPPFIRMESQSLAPLGSRKAKYHIPGELIQQPGVYRLSFRMRSRAEPLYFMRFCGATPDMIRSMNEWMVDVHPMTVEFEVR